MPCFHALATTVTVAALDIIGGNATVAIAAGDQVDRLAIAGSNDKVTIQHTSAVVPVIQMSGSNISVIVPMGYKAKTTISDTGTGNLVIEQ